VRPLGDVYKTERHPQVDDIFWVIEYANTSLEKDRDVKSAIYAQAGISEYWLVNMKTRELTAYRDPVGEQYQSETVLTVGMLYPLSFPTVGIEVNRLVQ
jgi:Uma2 family endonuclease